jgi:hypothetical protein
VGAAAGRHHDSVRPRHSSSRRMGAGQGGSGSGGGGRGDGRRETGKGSPLKLSGGGEREHAYNRDGGADDTLSLITSFDDDEEAGGGGGGAGGETTSGWCIGAGHYSRNNSGWMEFGRSPGGGGGGRGSGEGGDGGRRSTSESGFLSDFGSQQEGGDGGGTAGWGAEDEAASTPGNSWGNTPTAGGVDASKPVGFGWGAPVRQQLSRKQLLKQAPPQQESRRHVRRQSTSGQQGGGATLSVPQPGLGRGGGGAPMVLVQQQQEQIGTLVGLLVQQQQQIQQDRKVGPLEEEELLLRLQPEIPQPALGAADMPGHSETGARPSAYVGRTRTVQSMIRSLQHTKAPWSASPTAAWDVQQPPAAVGPASPGTTALPPSSSSRGSSGGAAGSKPGASGDGSWPGGRGTQSIHLNTSSALAEYDAVSRDLRAQFLERLRASQAPGKVAGVAAAAAAAAAAANAASASEATLAPAGVMRASAEGVWPGASDGSDEGGGSTGEGGVAGPLYGEANKYEARFLGFAAGEPPPEAGSPGSYYEGAGDGEGGLSDAAPAEAPAAAGSILETVQQLRGSVVELQEQLGLNAPAATRPTPASAPHRGPPPPPPLPFGLGGAGSSPSLPAASHTPRRRVPLLPLAKAGLGQAAGAPYQQGAGAAVTGKRRGSDEGGRAALMQDIASAGTGAGPRLRHVQRASALQRAAAERSAQ